MHDIHNNMSKLIVPSIVFSWLMKYNIKIIYYNKFSNWIILEEVLKNLDDFDYGYKN